MHVKNHLFYAHSGFSSLSISTAYFLKKFAFVIYRDYARSKLCVSKAVKSGCAIGDLMEDDLYNPFCIDGIDPLSLPSTAGMLNCLNSLVFKKQT